MADTETASNVEGGNIQQNALDTISHDLATHSNPIHTKMSGLLMNEKADTNNNDRNVFIIGIGGGTASGKTSVSERIIKNLNVPWVVLISMDSFYRVLTPEQSALAFRNDYNFDHPDAFEFPLLYDSLKRLKMGLAVEIPNYDFSLHARKKESQLIYGASVIIFEGILSLYDTSVLSLMDLKIFVDTDADVRLSRRLIRDISERGRDLKGILEQYDRFVKPAFDDFIRPTLKNADIIIPRGLDNEVAIDLITKHISRKLEERKIHYREDLVHIYGNKTGIPHQLSILPMKNDTKMLHTMIRDESTSKDDFMFCVHRLTVKLIAYVINEFEYQPKDVITPCNVLYSGLNFCNKLCAVSISGTGVILEECFRSVARDVVFGQIFIQAESENNQNPKIHYATLPSDISDRQVILLDVTSGTGSMALLAIRVLLEHSVPQEKITFISLISTLISAHTISSIYPNIRMVTTELDGSLNSEHQIIPGLGNFTKRYFCSQ
jgi:uridine kinase